MYVIFLKLFVFIVSFLLYFQLNLKNKNKIADIDKALVELQDKVRQTTSQVQKKPKNIQSKLPTVNQEQVLKTKQQSEEALKVLDRMQL